MADRTLRPLPDADQRATAWTRGENLVVEASAGTGKTALLTRRAMWFLLEKGVRMERTVVLAFGEKAAAEARERLRKSLRAAAAADSLEELGGSPELASVGAVTGLREVRSRAARALASFERGHVSTIHSFASTILRLYPVEAGVDPAFRVVEEPGARKELRAEWDLFLAAELDGEKGPHLAEWKEILGRVGIEEMEELGMAMAEFRHRDIPVGPASGKLAGPVREWLEGLKASASRVREALAGGRPGKALSLVESAEAVVDSFLAGDRSVPVPGPKETRVGWPARLDAATVAAGKEVARAMDLLKGVGEEELAARAVSLLAPFARRARARLLERGLMTYDALIALACGLLRENAAVREELKRRFDAILVDEVQDVDPLQLELILWLSEKNGSAAAAWEKISLEPGKLVLVGDPKQSIYGFRGASFTAYGTVTGMALRQGAAKVELTTSMRSAKGIIDLVNRQGPGLFPEGGTPGYLPLELNPARGASAGGASLLRVSGRHEEAREVAEWLARGVREGRLDPGEIGMLFRTGRNMAEFGEQLKLRGIAVSVGGSGSFFLRREVSDLILAFRLCVNPGDSVALAGFLRSPYGGLDDGQLAALFGRMKKEGSPADLDGAARMAGSPEPAGTLKAITGLSRTLYAEPGRNWAETLREALVPGALAAASASPGAAAAVSSFMVLLGDLLVEYGVTGTAELLDQCVSAEQEGESPPAGPRRAPEPAPGEVRLMTVHQAKGLEFPVVVLTDLMTGGRPEGIAGTGLLEDWSTGLTGVIVRAVGSRDAVSTLDAAFLRAENRRREREELRRTLYVAMTRARERLVISWPSPGPGGRGGPAEDSFMPLLDPLVGGAGGLLEEEQVPTAAADAGASVPRKGRMAGARAAARRKADGKPWEVVERRASFVPTPALSRPSDIEERFVTPGGEESPPAGRSAVQWLGELCHRALERWDFHRGGEQAGPLIAEVAAGMGARARVPSAMAERAAEMLGKFSSTEAAGALARAEILGREVPLLARVGDRVVSARADILFRLDGRLVVGDYKLAKHPKVPPEAAGIYAGAATAALGEKSVFATISIGAGEIAYHGRGGGG